jgi:hypothetical protein
MLADLTLEQRQLVLDPSPHVAGLCPRRAGKSYAGASAALITGEAKPGSISIIISLNLKQLRRLYWAGGPSGLFTLSRKYGLNLDFNQQYLRWEHENGSIGYLLGAEDREQLEVIRGLEADVYIIDECKSFAPHVLRTLIDEIIDPQRASRQGRLILIGTPGNIPDGPFFEATSTKAVRAVEIDGKQVNQPFLVGYGEEDPWGRTPKEDLLWSFHHWTLQANRAQPHLWEEALRKKRQMKWADDDPTWLREYLGLWATDAAGLVFRYLMLKPTGRVTWTPRPTTDNHLGLPVEGAPWRFVAGLDFGYEAPTALVVLAYSQRLGQVRHVYERSERHLLYHEVVTMVKQANEYVGGIEFIFADMGNLGKTLGKSLLAEGFPIEQVQKREKQDHIEIANSMFDLGEILIIDGSVLETQLMMGQWDLDKSIEKFKGSTDGENVIERLARLGKLVEDANIPNDSTDAFIYALRGCLHKFQLRDAVAAIVAGTKAWEKEQLRKFRAQLAKADAKYTGSALKRAPGFVRKAMGRTWTRTSTASTSTTWQT